MKPRSLNELRQTRDAVYTPPTSHDQSLRDRLEGRSYLVLDAEGLPEVTCDDVQCILDVRPTLSGEEVLAHFDGGATADDVARWGQHSGGAASQAQLSPSRITVPSLSRLLFAATAREI